MLPPHRSSAGTAERSTTTAREPHAFELLRAKLDVPSPRPGLVERTGLVGRLLASAERPSGQRRRTAGLRQDDDSGAVGGTRPAPVRLALARPPGQRSRGLPDLRRRGAERGDQPAVFKGLAGPGDSLWARGLPRLGLGAGRAPSRSCSSSTTCTSSRTTSAWTPWRAAPPRAARLAARALRAGRGPAGPGEASCRRRAARTGSAALALNDAEAHALLTAAGIDVTEDQAKALNERAEGWAAGLVSRGSRRWTAAARRSRPSAVTTASSPTTCEPRSSAASSRRSSSSCCGRPCSSPCAPRSAMRCSSATTRRQLLEQLERENLFVVALDHQRRWFRYHHLFREMLQAELERREPELSSALNRRAAAWCRANGQPEVAIEYSAAAGDTDEARQARRPRSRSRTTAAGG